MVAITANPTKWPIRRSSDNLGTVRDLAEYDEATDTTAIVDHYVYDAFGNETDHTGSNDFLFKYTGRAFDEETGLQNNLNRWFDPAVGRWLSEDPIGFAAGDANVYRYVGNFATGATDPSGLKQALIVIIVDSTTMPQGADRFKPEQVQNHLNSILKGAGVNAKVVIITTGGKAPDYDKYWDRDKLGRHWGLNSAGPCDLFVEYYHYLHFNPELGGKKSFATTPGTPKTKIQSSYLNVWLTTLPGADLSKVYANILLHEIFWVGEILDKTDNDSSPLQSGSLGKEFRAKLKPISKEEAAMINAALGVDDC